MEAPLQDNSTDKQKALVSFLIDQAIQGDAESFGKLYDIYMERIYRNVLYRTGNRAEAEDITQQVFMKAWQAMGRYRQTASSFAAWLLKIAHNLTVDYYRQKKCVMDIDNEVIVDWKEPGPQEAAEERFDRHRLRRAIMQLPGDQQQVVLMGFIEECSYPEIAAALGKKEGNVRVIMHRALIRIRNILMAEGAR